MSVQTTHYIVDGVLIKDKDAIKAFFDFAERNYDHFVKYTNTKEQNDDGIHIIADDMSGEYIVIGKVLAQSDDSFEMTRLLMPDSNIFQDIMAKVGLGVLPMPIDSVGIFVFTHWR